MSVRITLNIEATSSEELRQAVFDIASSYDGEDAGEDTSPPAEAPKNRGGRPRKPKADAPPPTPASGEPETPGSPEVNLLPGTADGQPAPAAASEPAAGDVTKDQVVTALKAAMESVSPLALSEALKKEGLGARLSEIKPEDYAKAVKVLNELTLTS